MIVDAILFDFDGVLIDSEYVGNRHLAQVLTQLGHPTSEADSFARFMGLSGRQFHDAIEQWIGGPIPERFHELRRVEDARAVADGIETIAGAVAFVRALPPGLPRAITSSSRSDWLLAHLDHIGLRDAFGTHVYSGREHVERGKPAPDLYWHAAERLGVPIGRCAIIEDSPVGVSGAVASGAMVIGLCAGTHCASDHADRLRSLGVKHIADGFDDVARLLEIDGPA